MRKILLVHNELYLERAVQDVVGLFGFEQPRARKDEVLDLLAVIVTPLPGDAHALSEDQTCGLGCLTNYAQLFSPESVSVSGIWLLVTVSPSDAADSTKRQEALSRILNVLQVKDGARKISAVIPVFPSEESQDSIAEQVTYLESEHRNIPRTNPLSIDFHEYPPNLTKVRLRTVPE